MYTPKSIAEGVVGLAQVAAGVDLASEEVISARREACRNCAWSTRNASLLTRPSKGLTVLSRCLAKCGCFIAAKSQLNWAKCPRGLWPSNEPLKGLENGL